MTQPGKIWVSSALKIGMLPLYLHERWGIDMLLDFSHCQGVSSSFLHKIPPARLLETNTIQPSWGFIQPSWGCRLWPSIWVPSYTWQDGIQQNIKKWWDPTKPNPGSSICKKKQQQLEVVKKRTWTKLPFKAILTFFLHWTSFHSWVIFFRQSLPLLESLYLISIFHPPSSLEDSIEVPETKGSPMTTRQGFTSWWWASNTCKVQATNPGTKRWTPSEIIANKVLE